jgi:hypothetical protein
MQQISISTKNQSPGSSAVWSDSEPRSSRIKSRASASLNFCNSLNSSLAVPLKIIANIGAISSSMKNKGRLVLRPLARIRDSRCN